MLKMSNSRKCVPMCDVNIVLEQLLAKDSFDESYLCIHFCYIKIRDKFCLKINPKAVFIFYFYIKKQSDLLQPQRVCLC